jgi:hypothetical protein
VRNKWEKAMEYKINKTRKIEQMQHVEADMQLAQ